MSTLNTSINHSKTSFTIVIPTYNEEQDIEKTLDALTSLNYSNFEVLVVDASTDNTPEIVQNYDDERIKYLRQTRGYGRSAARNQGILNAKGEIVVILNADVHLPNDFLSCLHVHYIKGADYVLVESEVKNVEFILPRYIQSQHRCFYGPNTKINMNWTEGFSCRRSAAISVGLFPEGSHSPLVAGEDGWFGELLEKNGYKRVFDRDMLVKHVMPINFGDFYNQRLGRGWGVSQIWYQRYKMSIMELIFRTIFQTFITVFGILLIFPVLRNAFRYSSYSSKGFLDFLPFAGIVAVEGMTNMIGIWKGLFESFSVIMKQRSS